MSILDRFEVGDSVEWITIRMRGKTTTVRKFTGVIDEIRGARAMVISPDYKRRKSVSLFDLKVLGGVDDVQE